MPLTNADLKTMSQTGEAPADDTEFKKPLLPYQSPRLEAFGDVRGLTLGGSKVPSDSGTALRRVPV